ncbi:hypothetical protein JXI42_03370 [bacterium]|nr:hypothetical protein [bacterium]
MDDETTKIKAIGSEVKVNSWINLEVKIVELWNAKSDKIAQTGLFGDDTGTVRFTSWKVSNLPEFEKDKCYIVKNAVVNSWNGKLQLNLNRKTEIQETDADIEVSVKEPEVFKGEIIGLTNRTAAILKCPKCSRPVTKNFCNVHKDITPKKDLRLGLRIKVDEDVKVVEFRGREAQRISGFTAEAAHSYEPDDFLPDLERKLVGKTLEFTCTESKGYFYGKNARVLL